MTHLRPIDQLVMILTVDNQNQDFNDFVEKYTLIESGVMLLQIICEGN